MIGSQKVLIAIIVVLVLIIGFVFFNNAVLSWG